MECMPKRHNHTFLIVCRVGKNILKIDFIMLFKEKYRETMSISFSVKSVILAAENSCSL